MLFSGEWFDHGDGVLRPTIRLIILDANDDPRVVPFVVDSGADRTVLTAPVLNELNLPLVGSQDQLTGLGGLVESRQIKARFFLRDMEDNLEGYSMQLMGLLRPDAVDFCLLGQDFLSVFSLILDQQRGRVFLMSGNHDYQIVMSPPTP